MPIYALLKAIWKRDLEGTLDKAGAVYIQLITARITGIKLSDCMNRILLVLGSIKRCLMIIDRG